MSKKSPYNPIEKHPFAPIPLNILKHEKLSPGAKLVYGYLCSRFGKDGLINVKSATIADAICINIRQIKRYIAELKREKLIETKRTGRSSLYYFISLPSEVSDVSPHEVTNVTSQNQEVTDTTPREVTNMTLRLYNNKRKQLKENNNVVVASSEISFLLDRIKDEVDLEDQGLLEALKEGLAKFGRESMVERIEYANKKANGNYPGFLATMIRKGWRVPDLKKDQTPPPSNQPSLSISLAGKTILYKGEEYTIDPEALCIRPKAGGVLPIGMILQAVKRGTIKVVDIA